MSGGPRERVAAICAALPETTARAEDRHMGYEVGRRRFAWFLDDHHGDGRVALHCRAAPGANRELAAGDPGRFFVPPYVGARGWVGVWLDDARVDWDLVEKVLRDAYRLAAPKRLAGALD